MMVCEHCSQRSTCPPSAAVRQRSIAVITFNCSRLTWPALAERQVAPWSRKISATPRFGRHIAAGGLAGWRDFLAGVPPGFRGPLLYARQLVERALDGGDHAGGDVGIARRGVWLGVTQQRLDGSDMDLAFEQMGGEAVAQRMHVHPLFDPRSVGRCME